MNVRSVSEYAFELPAPASRVFPLFDPLHESLWAPEWRPQAVYPVPLAPQRNAVFTTEHGDERAVWTMVEHRPADGVVAYLVVRPERSQIWITIHCSETGGGSMTRVVVRYEVTALSLQGRVDLERYDRAFLSAWEAPLRHYLATGTALQTTKEHDPPPTRDLPEDR